MKKWVNPISRDTILLFSKDKAFAYDRLEVTRNKVVAFEMIENNVEKGENAGYQHFSFSHNVFTSLPVQYCVAKAWSISLMQSMKQGAL